MMELTELVSDIKKEGKMSVDGLLMTLADAVQKEDDPMCIYKELYKKAYGEHLSESVCRDWVSKMAYGEKWTCDQTTDVGQRAGINWSVISKWEWYAAMNGAYSDYKKVGALYQIEEDADLYASLAKAFWLEDDDVHDKTVFSYYFNYVA